MANTRCAGTRIIAKTIGPIVYFVENGGALLEYPFDEHDDTVNE